MAARKLLIQNGTIVTCSSTLEPYEPTVFRGDLFVVDGVISKIDKKINISDTSDIEVIDATDQLVIPGFVDAHRHVWEGAYKWAGDWSLWEYAAKFLWQLASRIEARDAYVSQSLGILEALNAGVTSIVDHCHFTPSEEVVDSMLEATRKSGIRSYFCYARVDQFPYGAKRKEWQMAHLEKLVKEGMGSDRVTLGLAFDGSDNGFFNELKDELFPFADKHGIDIFSTNYLGGPNPIGEGGVHAFASRGFLENRSILFVHANSLQSSEHELLRNSSSAVVSTPEIEQSMALGPTVGFTAEDAGVRVGLGVDCACAVGGDMFRVMRSMLAYQRGHENQEILKKGKVPLKLQRRTKDVFRMATIGGARAIRREHEIGTLEVGKKADIVLINATSPSMLGAERDPVRAIVMHATVEDVNKVIVGGEVLVDKSRSSRDGVFTRLKWSDEVNKVRDSLARISSTFKNQEHEEEEAFASLQDSLSSMGVNFVGAGDR